MSNPFRLLRCALALAPPLVWLFLAAGALAQGARTTAPGARLLVYQGDYHSLGDVASIARKMAQFDVLVLSHVSTRGPTARDRGDCLDAAYQPLADLIRLVRQAHPRVRIFGYIPATADAPLGSACGMKVGLRHLDRNWQCPGGVCSNAVSWVDDWLQLPVKIDGIFVDLVAPGYISPVTRDNIFSYIKLKGLRIMANVTVPADEHVAFAGDSRFLGRGDYIMIEGFYRALGNPTARQTIEAVERLGSFGPKGVLLAALSTEARAQQAGQMVSCRSPQAREARAFFSEVYERGDVFQFTTGDLGVTAKVVPTPCI